MGGVKSPTLIYYIFDNYHSPEEDTLMLSLP